jgi:hypothetical protein
MNQLFSKRNRFFLIITLLFLILRLPSLFEPYWYGDEGIYLVLGQAIRKGLVLYRDIHDNKPPTLYYLAAIAKTVFGFRLLLAVFMGLAYFYYQRLVEKLFSPTFARVATVLFLVISSIPLVEGNIANAEVFMLFPTILGIYYFLFSTSKWRFLFSGLSLGLAFTLKVPVAIEFALLMAWVLAVNEKGFNLAKIFSSWIQLGVGFALPIVVQFIYYSARGAGNVFLFSALLQNFGYLSSWSTGSHSGGATSGGLVYRGILLAISWLTLYFLYWKKFITKYFLFVSTWFCATLFGALLSTRPYPHYLVQVLPPLVLLVISLFAVSSKVSNRLISIFLIAVLALSLVKYKFYFYPVLSYYRNFYSHVFKLNSTEYRNYFGSRVDDTYKIADFIKSNTTDSEQIFIWGDEPYIYALSSRLPVGRYTVAYHVADFNQYANTFSELLVKFPKVIIYYPQPSRPFPDLDNFIRQYYSPAAGFGDAAVYFRND